MRILYVAFRYDYGFPDRGPSFEHFNFYESLLALGHDLEYFDIGTELSRRGRDGMNAHLLKRVRDSSPDLMFTCMMGDELDPAVVRRITDESSTPTFNWFCDDHWRFEQFTSRWAPCFSWVSTTAGSALPKYAALGYSNVIRTQWAAADTLYQRRDLPLAHDMTFVGQVYGDRPAVIRQLRSSGIDVQTWGTGWSVQRRHELAAALPIVRAVGGRRLLERLRASTRCDQDRMLAIFEQSRINLDLVTSSQGTEPQIKGRTFEVPACGGFLLEGQTEGIEDYFEPGREIVLYGDVDELISTAGYYLRHEDERRRIASAGHDRVHAEHTYRHRFGEIFRRMGLTA